MDGVIEVADVDGPHSHTDQGDHLGQLLAKLIQLRLQRSLLLLGGSHLVTNLADLSGHSGGHSHTDGLASSDVSALQRGGEEERGQESGREQETGVDEDWMLMLVRLLQRKACFSCPG